MEITFRPGSDLSKKPISYIQKEVITGLVNCQFITKEDVIKISVEKHKYAYPIYDLNHRKNTDIIQKYLNEIGMVPLLNAQEERQLSQTIEAGTEARARQEAGETGVRKNK